MKRNFNEILFGVLFIIIVVTTTIYVSIPEEVSWLMALLFCTGVFLLGRYSVKPKGIYDRSNLKDGTTLTIAAVDLIDKEWRRITINIDEKTFLVLIHKNILPNPTEGQKYLFYRKEFILKN